MARANRHEHTGWTVIVLYIALGLVLMHLFVTLGDWIAMGLRDG